jgi:hypothetical protein
MNVKLVKLVSGEEFVAEIVNRDTNLSCKNMIKFMMTPQRQLAMVPLNPFIPQDTVVEFNNSHIMFVSDVEKEVENNYAEQFGGIVTSPSKLIV